MLMFVGGWLGWQIGGRRLAVFNMAMMAAIGLIGMWALSLDTLTQVVAAVVLSVLIALPLGIWTGRNPRAEAFLAPILDALQTIPPLVYIIPAVIFFTVGVVPGIIASVLYACVPGIRITAPGIREVLRSQLRRRECSAPRPVKRC